jgi:hypothetical protein
MSIQLLDKERNEVVHVAESDVSDAVRSGRYALDTSKTYNVTVDGQVLENVDGNRILDNIKNNAAFRFETGEETQARKDYQQYGGTANAIVAFGEGAAQDLTMGGYGLAASALGAGEGVAGRARVNPFAAGAGEVVSTIGQIALTGGLGAGKKLLQEAGERVVKEGVETLAEQGIRRAPGILDREIGRAHV